MPIYVYELVFLSKIEEFVSRYGYEISRFLEKYLEMLSVRWMMMRMGEGHVFENGN